MATFSKDKDFWGNTIYYDENGEVIGHKEETWLGDSAVYHNGEKVADIQRDFNGNEEIVIKSNSIFENDIIIQDKNYQDDWWYSEESEKPDDDGDDF